MDVLQLVFISLLVVVSVLIAVFFFLGVFKPQLPSMQDYEKQDHLLSNAELVLFNELLKSVADDKYVCAKVRIGDLVRVRGLAPESPAWWSKFGPIAKKHVDFVVCERKSMKTIVAVELDDSSHQTERGRARDALVDQVMHAAGLPLCHVPYSTYGYQTGKIRFLLREATTMQVAAGKTKQAREGEKAQTVS